MSVPIYFYLSPEQWPDPIPERYDLSWPGFGDGHYNWSLQSYLLLRDHGVECELSCDVGDKPCIIIAHRASLTEGFKAKPGQLLVCMQADWGRHPYAQVHICQNLAQTRPEGSHFFYSLFWPANTYFVRHWPQPDLIARDQSRPAELNCLAYFGIDYNLAPELRSDEWKNFLADIGVEWRLVGEMSDWGNFSQIDAVLFVRDFDGNPHYNKPSTKLYNAWLAKCLPVCTPEPAYLDESGRDDLETVYVDDFESLKASVKHLKQNPEEFAKRIEAAIVKSQEYTNQRITDEWVEAFRKLREIEYPKYANSSFRRWLFHRVRDVSVVFLAMIGKLKP